MSWLIFHILHPLMDFEFPFDWLSPYDFHQMKQWFGQHYSCSKYFPQGYSPIALLSLSPPCSSGQSCFGSAPKLYKLFRFRWFLLIHGFENWTPSELDFHQGLAYPGWGLGYRDLEVGQGGHAAARCLGAIGVACGAGQWGPPSLCSCIQAHLYLLASSWSWERTCCALLELWCFVLFTFLLVSYSQLIIIYLFLLLKGMEKAFVESYNLILYCPSCYCAVWWDGHCAKGILALSELQFPVLPTRPVPDLGLWITSVHFAQRRSISQLSTRHRPLQSCLCVLPP